MNGRAVAMDFLKGRQSGRLVYDYLALNVAGILCRKTQIILQFVTIGSLVYNYTLHTWGNHWKI